MKSRSYYMRQKGPGILLALQLAHARETCHAWNLLPLPAPPYTVDVMTGVQGASKKRAARTRAHLWSGCANADAWRYEWGDRHLLSAADLCATIAPNANVVLLGDSLSAQLVWSWAARLLATANSSAFEFGLDRRQRSVPRCGHGGVVRQPAAARVSNLVLAEGFDFAASDPRCRTCASRVRREPTAFGLDVTYFDALEQTLENATVVVVNQFAHLFKFVSTLATCYRDVAALAPDHAMATARRDVGRFWAAQTAALASALRRIPARVFYRTSPPAADVLRANGPVCPADVLGAGAARAAGWEYGHDLYAGVNDLSVSAFLAAGHGIIDLEWMLGVRVDAHPGPSLPKHPQGDHLHFCLPGVPDYALDAMLFAIFGQRSNLTGASA